MGILRKTLCVLVPLLLTAGGAHSADEISSVTINSGEAVTPLTAREANAVTTGAQMAGVCLLDNFGYTWNLSGAGRVGPNISLTGTASFCGGTSGPANGTIVIAPGLPADVTGAVDASCGFCNAQHQFVVTFDRNTRTFNGTAFSFDGCEGQGPTTLGRCPQ